MHTLRTVLFVIFVVDSLLLVIAILLQSGRGGGLAGALGGIGGAESALGVRAASQIEKATGVLAVIFFGTALALAYTSPEHVAAPVDVQTGERGGAAAIEAGPAEEAAPGEAETLEGPADEAGAGETSAPPAELPVELPADTPTDPATKTE